MRLGYLVRIAVLGLVGLASACSSNSGNKSSGPGRDGVIALFLTDTPSDVLCLELDVMNSNGSVTIQTRRFDVSPGQPASANATGLPVGEWLLLAEKAYNVTCNQVIATTPATWFSPDATSVKLISGVPASVNIVLHPVGNGSVGVTSTFQTPPDTCAGWTCSPWSYGTGDGCNCNCGCWDPDCGGLDGGAGGGQGSGGGGGSPADGGTSGISCSSWQMCVQPGVCQDVACMGWMCPLSWYGDGMCQGGCGCPDPDCQGGVDGGGADGGGGVCAGWICPTSWYADGMCDSSCGCPDPDCQGGVDGGGPGGAGGMGGSTGTGGMGGSGGGTGTGGSGPCSTCAWGQTFESNDGGFTVSGALTTWAWGVPTGGSGDNYSFPTGAHSGAKVWGTNLAGNYRANEDGYLTSHIIDMSAHAGRAVTVSWWEWSYVWGGSWFVEASKDGGTTWNNIRTTHTYWNDWHRVAVVLDSSYSVSNFQVRFRFTANSSPGTSAGLYIDDVCVAPGGLGAYQTNFEANNAGFEVSGPTSWAWGVPSPYCDSWGCGPNSAHGGANAWATNLTGNYGNNENGYLTSPVIDLSSLSAEPSIDLRWWDWLYSEPSYDLASVEVSTDGGTSWQPSPVWGPPLGNQESWQVHDIALPSSYAVPNFRIRFHFTSDAFNSYAGWYVDDLSVQGTTVDACAPTFDTPIPSCQCNGTGPGGVPITASCGQSACGMDYMTYSCDVSGWSFTGQACGADAGAGGDAGACQCSGTGPGGTPITVSCGQSACGSNLLTYSCSAAGWSEAGPACGPDAGSDAGGCECSGTGPSGPVTVSCGQSACGSNHFTYSCSASGWSGPGSGC